MTDKTKKLKEIENFQKNRKENLLEFKFDVDDFLSKLFPKNHGFRFSYYPCPKTVAQFEYEYQIDLKENIENIEFLIKHELCESLNGIAFVNKDNINTVFLFSNEAGFEKCIELSQNMDIEEIHEKFLTYKNLDQDILSLTVPY